MVTTKLDLQSPNASAITETPAECARQAVAKYRAKCLDDVYHSLLGIIATESAKGAVGLSLYHYGDSKQPIVETRNLASHYLNGMVDVTINVAPIIDHESLIKHLESAGFAVTTMPSDEYGVLIDIISWE